MSNALFHILNVIIDSETWPWEFFEFVAQPVAVDIALAVEIPTQALRGRSLALGCGPIEAIDGTPVVDIKPVLVDAAPDRSSQA